jgi:hypothetical protein
MNKDVPSISSSNFIKRVFLFILLSIFTFTISVNTVLALSEEQKKVIHSGIYYFDTEFTESQCPSSSTPSGGGAPNASVESFVDTYGEFAYRASINTGVPYEFTLAQAMVESGYGQSGLTTEANNFFGIKAGSSWDGEVYVVETREVDSSGREYWVDAAFRKYSSPEDSFRDHDIFLRENQRYSAAFNYSNDPHAFLVEIKNAGYATDPNYIAIVGSVIDSTIAYIASTGSWPPSSEITYNVDPIGGESSRGGTNSTCGSGVVVFDTSEPDFSSRPSIQLDSSPSGPHRASNCSGPTGSPLLPGTLSLANYIETTWPDVGTVSKTVVCRSIRGGTQTSVHGIGRAIDVGIGDENDFEAPTSEELALGNEIRNVLINNAETLGLQRIIWNNQTWSSSQGGWSPYTGTNPHHGHLHIEVNIEAANQPNLAGGS